MLRWFPRLQVATACFSCSLPDLNFLDPYFIFMYMHYNHCHRATAYLQLNILLLLFHKIGTLELWKGWLHNSSRSHLRRICHRIGRVSPTSGPALLPIFTWDASQTLPHAPHSLLRKAWWSWAFCDAQVPVTFEFFIPLKRQGIVCDFITPGYGASSQGVFLYTGLSTLGDVIRRRIHLDVWRLTYEFWDQISTCGRPIVWFLEIVLSL